jgi:hypothetical protein
MFACPRHYTVGPAIMENSGLGWVKVDHWSQGRWRIRHIPFLFTFPPDGLAERVLPPSPGTADLLARALSAPSILRQSFDRKSRFLDPELVVQSNLSVGG